MTTPNQRSGDSERKEAEKLSGLLRKIHPLGRFLVRLIEARDIRRGHLILDPENLGGLCEVLDAAGANAGIESIGIRFARITDRNTISKHAFLSADRLAVGIWL